MRSSSDGLQLMIVDDNRQMRVLLREILRGLGIRNVLEAGDGIEALEVMRHNPVDLALVDWNMDPLDGIEFVRMLRRAPDSPNPYCLVVMVTGHANRARVAEARDAGVNSFLVKPVTARALADHINAAVKDTRPFVRHPSYAGPDRRRADDPSYRGPRRRDNDDTIDLDQDDWATSA